MHSAMNMLAKMAGSLRSHFRKKRPAKGMAVIMALSVVLLLITATMEIHMAERSNMLTAAILRDRQTLEQMASAAINMGMAVLVKDRQENESDSLQEDWADKETLAAHLEEIPFEQGKLTLSISDEMGKIQINALVTFPQGREFNEPQHHLWERFAAGLLSSNEDLEDTDALTIINSVKDWLDSGDADATTGFNSAESDYYESLDPPYSCKNGPFDHLSEVSLVKGITPELFSGMGGSAGLSAYLTVYGAEKAGDQGFTYPGKININTAELPVLAALLPIDAAMYAQNMIEYREALSGTQFTYDLASVNWYKNVPGLSDVSIDPSLISVSSDIFCITATAALNDVHLTTTAVIQREKPSEKESWKCKVLNWKTE